MLLPPIEILSCPNKQNLLHSNLFLQLLRAGTFLNTSSCPVLQMEVSLSDGKDITDADKRQINKDLRLFLQPVRERLLKFEQELKDR